MLVSSAIVENSLQRDGRLAIREQHVDAQGNVYTQDYLADPGTDTAALLATHAAQITASQTATEIQHAIQLACSGGDPRIMPCYWNTQQQVLTGVMQFFLASATPQNLLAFQPIASTFTADGIAQTLGVSSAAAQAIVNLISAVGTASAAVLSALQQQAQTAAQLGM